MRILFTKSNSLASRVIREVTNSNISHVAIELDWGILHSDFSGVQLTDFATFAKENEIVEALEKQITTQADEAHIYDMIVKYDQSWYDFGALVFLGISIMLKHWFGLKPSKKNLWQSSGAFLCTEFVGKFTNLTEIDMLTPAELYTQMKNNPDWKTSNDYNIEQNRFPS